MASEPHQELEELGRRIGLHILGVTVAINDSWRREFITVTVPGLAWTKVWVATAAFGAYLLRKRFSAPLGEEKAEIVNKVARDKFLAMAPELFKGTEGEEAKAKRRNYIISEFDDELDSYDNYDGADSREVFCYYLTYAFNFTDGSKIKFIENTFWTKLKLKLSFMMLAFAGDKEWFAKHDNEVFLPRERLELFANSALQAFTEIPAEDVLGR